MRKWAWYGCLGGVATKKDKSKATYADDGEPWRCAAKTKNGDDAGRRCKNSVVPNRTVCRKHGGLAGAKPKPGAATDTFLALGEQYVKAKESPGLLDLERPLAVLDMAAQRMIERLEERDTPDFRRRARDLFNEAQDLSKTDPAASAALNKLGALLKRGASEDVAFKDVQKVVSQFARRLEEVWKIKLARSQVVNQQDLVGLLTRIATWITEVAPEEVADQMLRKLDEELVVANNSMMRREHNRALKN